LQQRGGKLAQAWTGEFCVGFRGHHYCRRLAVHGDNLGVATCGCLDELAQVVLRFLQLPFAADDGFLFILASLA
jgi:hypothetical protein